MLCGMSFLVTLLFQHDLVCSYVQNTKCSGDIKVQYHPLNVMGHVSNVLMCFDFLASSRTSWFLQFNQHLVTTEWPLVLSLEE